MIAWCEAKQRPRIHIWRIYDFAGVENARRVKKRFQLAKRRRQLRAKHHRIEFRTRQAIAMFTRMRSTIFLYQFKRFGGDRFHLLHVCR